ncbi:MAG: hypothetical protein GXO74_11680 [Calditrichaeota bacterium]|nr:hypothetical protein [Calditrichota bacterium]
MNRKERSVQRLLILFFIFFSNIFPVAAKPPSFLPGKFQCKSYFHLRYSFIENDVKNKISEDHWSLRRFKLAADWQINQKVTFYAQATYKTNNYSATDDEFFLEHAYFKYSFGKSLNLKIGQFKPPFGWERFQADSRLPTTERSQAINRLIPNGSLGESFVRDYGAQFFGKVASFFQYEFALMTGNGANNGFADKNFPLVVARLSYKRNLNFPAWRKKVQFLSQFACSYRQNGDNNFVKQLPGCDKSYFQHFAGNDRRKDYAVALTSGGTQLAAEYLSAVFLFDGAEIATVRASGWFCQYSQFLTDRWQCVLRYEHFDPNRSIKNSHDLSWLTIGVDYYFNNKWNRILLNYVHKIEAADEMKNDEFVVQLQYFLFGSR